MVGYLKGHCHWSVVDQFHHHGCLIAAAIKATDILVLCGIKTSAARRNVAWRVLASVWKAGLIHDAKILDILSDQVRKPTITALTRGKEIVKNQMLRCECLTDRQTDRRTHHHGGGNEVDGGQF